MASFGPLSRVDLVILVGGFNPSEKYAGQIGSIPQGFRVNI